jgi:hypothetical protein
VVTATREKCPGCGFVWDDIDQSDVSPRILAAAHEFADVLATPRADARPEPARWSVIEYGAHLRDVLLVIRDRVILAAVEECPSPPPMYRDHRVALGLYADDSASVVAGDLAVAARLFTSTFDRVAPEYAERTLIYSQLLGDERTIRWTGAQAVHESEHHLDDARENVRLLSA